MRFLPFIFCFIILVQAGVETTWAHGVGTRNSHAKANVITAFHDDGSPLAFADYSVTSPLGGPSFTQGKTDSLGRAVFLPNVPGKWEIKIFSTDGHGSVTTVDVQPSGSLPSHNHENQGLGQIQKFITGGSVLFGIFGLLVLIQNRKPGKE